MKRASLLLTLVGAMLFACTGVVMAQSTTPDSSRPDPAKKIPKGKKIAGSYIVVLKQNEDPEVAANKKERELGGKVEHVYEHALKGFSIEISDDQAEELRANPEVAYVEQDQVATAEKKKRKKKRKRKRGGGGPTPAPAPAPPPPPPPPPPPSAQQKPWGIDRIDADLSSTRAGDGSGAVSGVNVYVIDTGVDGNHPDLNVADHLNFTGDGANHDCNGHGTHVAGTLAAEDNARDVVGVAPGAPITGVKVLGCSASGRYSDVIAGVDWVTANANKPAVANMSLGGGASQALDDAVIRSAASGVFYSIAAGNEGSDACGYSPARAGAGTANGIMTTGATDGSNAETSFSNHGSCVDVWAPGASIPSTRLGGGTTTMSGTSMAAAHVGGTGALYLLANTSASAAAVESAIKLDAGNGGTLVTNKNHNIVYAGRY